MHEVETGIVDMITIIENPIPGLLLEDGIEFTRYGWPDGPRHQKGRMEHKAGENG
jgi:hypothetical protein